MAKMGDKERKAMFGRLKSRNLGFASFKDIPNQKPFQFRDGKITPTHDNPASNTFTGDISIGFLPDSDDTQSEAKGQNIEYLDKNSVKLTSKGFDSGWSPDQPQGSPNRANFRVLDKRDKDVEDYWGRYVEADSVIIKKRNSDQFDIKSDNDDIRVKVV